EQGELTVPVCGLGTVVGAEHPLHPIYIAAVQTHRATLPLQPQAIVGLFILAPTDIADEPLTSVQDALPTKAGMHAPLPVIELGTIDLGALRVRYHRIARAAV